jgi:hypothetical protein
MERGRSCTTRAGLGSCWPDHTVKNEDRLLMQLVTLAAITQLLLVKPHQLLMKFSSRRLSCTVLRDPSSSSITP